VMVARRVRRVVVVVGIPVLMPGIGRVGMRGFVRVGMSVIVSPIPSHLREVRLQEGSEEHRQSEDGRARKFHKANLGPVGEDSKSNHRGFSEAGPVWTGAQ
jgi:hypothetical protein